MAMSSVRQLRQRTVPLRPTADAPYRSGGPDDPTATDPLGIGATARGMYDASTGDWPLLGPLPDPRWVGFFQTLKDRDAIVGPAAGARGSRVHEFPVDTSGTAGDELAGVADSMSGQPGAIQSLRRATDERQAAAAAKQQAVTATAAPTAPTPPPAPPPPGGPRDPTLARERYQAAQMRPGSLAALRQRMFSGE
jgi:hypothetical protein